MLLKNVKDDLENLEDLKVFIEYSNNIQYVYKSNREYKSSRKSNVLIVFDDKIADMISNKKLNYQSNIN